MAIPLNNTEMALYTGHPSGNILPVIEVPAFDLDIPFRLNMAGSTPSDGTGNALFLSFWASLVIMTDKAVDFVNSEM